MNFEDYLKKNSDKEFLKSLQNFKNSSEEVTLIILQFLGCKYSNFISENFRNLLNSKMIKDLSLSPEESISFIMGILCFFVSTNLLNLARACEIKDNDTNKNLSNKSSTDYIITMYKQNFDKQIEHLIKNPNNIKAV